MQVTTLAPGNAHQQQQAADQAAQVLHAGGLVIFPTETVYGVAASALSEQGVDRLRQLKSADASRAFTVHIHAPQEVQRYAELTGTTQRLALKAMPGPVTLLIEVDPGVIQDRLERLGLSPKHQDRLYHGGVVGLRCPDHSATRSLLAAVRSPVIASSANLHGEPPPVNADQAVKAIGNRVGLVVDGGDCRFAKPSTVVRITGRGTKQTLKVEREGVYDQRDIDKLTRYTVLMVCTGNTCRSPMAQGIARELIAAQLGIESSELGRSGIDVKSAGTNTSVGIPVTDEAVLAVAGQGIDLSGHRSSELTRGLVDEADVIYCMTAGHLQAVLALSPGAVGKTMTVYPDSDITDPIGAGLETYRETATAIRRGLGQRIKELPL